MTIHEQIQKALQFMEENLFRAIQQEDVARQAGMSPRSFQHYFWMITGYSYKEYLIKRRLSVSIADLLSSDKSILDIALDIGYQNHESFSRAFKSEFEISPNKVRQRRLSLRGLQKIELFKELYMGVIVKELPEMLAVVFKAFAPDPEKRAKEKLERWVKDHPAQGRPRRILGHNIDSAGNMCGPEYAGYKFYLRIDHARQAHGQEMQVIKPGKFLVTGIEGDLSQDPSGEFIKEGWRKLNRMMAEKGFQLKPNARWFEEELEPQKPGNLRLDLYAETED